MREALPARIVILLHARDRRAPERPYLLWALADEWRKAGSEVVVAYGPDRLPAADAIVNHVDLTVTPKAYREALSRYPLAVNGRCVDVSKRVVSGAILRPGDSWDGPVIVKTDANCGAKPEARILGRPLGRTLGGALRRAIAAPFGRRARERARWLATWRIPTDDYPVFASVRDLPSGVLDNRRLVVERFVPEREGDLCALRTWYFLGGQTLSRRVLAPGPIVKAGGIVRREWVDPHPDAVLAAKRLGLDYGKVDYVVHEGEATILDVNRTPTFGPRLDEAGRRSTGERLGPGLATLWNGGVPAR